MSGRNRFASKRADGKSKAEVVIELVSGGNPGDVFNYDQIASALSAGLDRTFERREVQQVVRLANHRLLRDHQRYLLNVENVGYRVAHARDHAKVAGVRNKRGQRQFKWAMKTLQHVRLDEMTEQERMIHQAQQVINTELYQQNRRILKRQEEQGRLIASLTHRVEQVEGRK